MSARTNKNAVTRRRATTMIACSLGWVIAGCSAPSLLITPVTSNRHLVETELKRDGSFVRDKIALIDVSGVLMNSRPSTLFSQGEHPVSFLLEQLDRARRDARVKAVILRINSPGGSVVASELMHDEIAYFKKRTGKPVYAVMMDVAASGGYYIACACDEIFAQPSTVTGSIGVIMQLFDVGDTMAKLGVRSEAITSGAMKDAGSPFRRMEPKERALFQEIVNDMFERFVDVIVAGRPKLDEAKIRSLADGRVYTATQAKDHGLIDEIRSLRSTIDYIKQKHEIAKIKLVTYHRALGYRPNYYAAAPQSSTGDVNLVKLDLSHLPHLNTPRFMYLWQAEH